MDINWQKEEKKNKTQQQINQLNDDVKIVR